MVNRIERTNPGMDDGWILEGDISDEDFVKLLTVKRISSLEFKSVTSFPDRPFRHFTGWGFLKYVYLKDCPIMRGDLVDLGALKKLRHLYFVDCPVVDEDVESLSSHPKLDSVWLTGTQITDESLRFIATIPNLKWLDLANTAVTDAGLPCLVSTTQLSRLRLENTQVTDNGILCLTGLLKLNLTAASVGGTQVTESGLDAFFAKRKAEQSSVRSRKTAQPLTAADKQASTLDLLPPAEIEAAKNLLYDFFKAMHEWETEHFQRYCAGMAQTGDEKAAEANQVDACREDCQKIFAEFCTAKKRTYGRPENISLGCPPDYEADPEQELVTSIETATKRRIVIETKQQIDMKWRHQYVLVKNGDRWLIDSKKRWNSGWEARIL